MPQRSTADERSFGWWGEIVVMSHLRFAAGVCVLTAGLLMGGAGGAVAVADPSSSGSTAHGDDGTKVSGQQSSTDAKKPKKKEPGGKDTKDEKKDAGGTDTKDDKKNAGGTDTKDDKKNAGGTDTKDEKKDAGGTDTKDEKKDAGVVAAVPDHVAPVPNAAAPAPNAVAPAPYAAAPVANLVGPVSDVIASVQDMLTPDAGAVVPLTQLQSDLYSFLLGIAGMAPVANLVGPVSDVIALIQDMLTPDAGAVVPLTQLQSDLYSFLLSIAGMGPAAGLGGLADAGPSPAADAWVASQWPRGLPVAAIPGGPLAGNAATGVATLDVTALGRASALSGMAPPPSNGAIPTNGAIPVGVRSFLRHTYSELSELPLPIAVSLSALFAAALPGVGGLVIISLAGVRVGYRQAKAGFALHAGGIARFAHPGAVPLGVVRSGSLVLVRPKASRVVRPGALRGGCLLDKVA